MGFFKSVGKAIGGAVKQVAKVVSVKNAINVVSGNYSAVVKDAVNRAKDAGLGLVGAVATSTGLIKTKSSPQTQLVKAGAVGVKASGVLATSPSLIRLPAKATRASVQFTQKDEPVSSAPAVVVASKGGSVISNLMEEMVADWESELGVKVKKDINKFIDKNAGKVFEKIGGELVEFPLIKSFMDRFSKVALKYYWAKYKAWILGGLALLIALVVWFFKFRKPKRGARRR